MEAQSEQSEQSELLSHQMARVQRYIQRRTAQVAQHRTTNITIMIAGILLVVFGLAKLGVLGPLVLIVAVVAYSYVARVQQRVSRSLLLYEAMFRLLKQQRARRDLDWGGMPPVPTREEIAEEEGEEDGVGGEPHPFDIDLDISGERSLHQLMNTAVSQEGTLRLRDWLLTLDIDIDTLRARRNLVRELIPLTSFRRKLQIYSLFATRFTSRPVDGNRLLDWLAAQADSKMHLSTLIISVLISALFYVSLLLYLFAHISLLVCLGLLVLSAVWFLVKRGEQGHLLEDVSYQRTAFGQMRIVFDFLEKYRYGKNVHLKELCAPFFLHGDRRPSVLLKKLERNFSRISAFVSSNEVWFVLNVFFPIGAITAYQLDQYKSQLSEYLPQWLDTWYELEALCSLANFAELNPDYTFPELVVDKKKQSLSEQSMVFDAQGLGHPLIPRASKVVNDVHLTEAGEIMLITGSNMAGKSTFLRTIGINLCLAYAGSVVNATVLRTSLFEVYACIRVTDSLAEGYSYFYAEVRRLRAILDELRESDRYPLFFLIDEIFKGTNNYERLIGSEAYMRALIGQRSTGAISTHDLELVQLSETFPIIKNYHFRENIIDGQMVFEYMLRPGPSPTRNALRIMEMEGLPVRWEGEPAVDVRPAL